MEGRGTELNAFIRFDKPRRIMGERGNEVVFEGLKRESLAQNRNYLME